jgi:hypothetical protein
MRQKLHDAAAFLRSFNANPLWLAEADRIDKRAEEGTIEQVEVESQRLVSGLAGVVRT